MLKLRKILLHVGLPKTGSSALQSWADANRQVLRTQGVDYPQTIDDTIVPKHQFLVPALMSNRLAQLDALLAESRCDKLFLSTEGLTNHLYDFPEKSLAEFRARINNFELSVFMVVRDPESWTRSYYKQAVINPPILACNYATPLRYEAFRLLPRVVRLTDVEKVSADVKVAYGASEVIAAPYNKNWFSQLIDFLDIKIDETFTPLPSSNESVSDDVIELIRQVNAMNVSPSLRDAFLALLQMSLNTRHNILIRNLQNLTGNTIPVDALADLLQKFVPENEKQAEIVEIFMNTHMENSGNIHDK